MRYYARHKAIVATIVMVHALGTGTNAMIFSLFQAQFLRPAPAVPDDDSHARIWGAERDTRLAPWHDRAFTHPELAALARHRDVFSDVAGWRSDEVALATDRGGARVVRAQYVTPNFFATLGVRPIAGQGLSRDASDAPDRTAVRSEEHTSELQSRQYLVCRLLLEKKKKISQYTNM